MINKKQIDFTDYATQIVKANPKGILLTTKAGDEVDSMVIGWGTLGTNWARPVFCAYVRENRHTISLLDRNPEFTVNIPLEGQKLNAAILRTCGTRSGRDTDKVTEAGLTLVDSDVVSVPGIAQAPLTLECKVIYRQLQQLDLYPADIAARDYPQNVDSTAFGANKDPHYTIFGQIVNAYIIEE